MKETLILTKTLFKNSLNKNPNDDKLNFKAIAKKMILILVIAYIACVMIFLTKELITILRENNQEELFISVFILLSLALSFFQSILASLNILYFSKDIEFLLPLPINSIKIVFAKINVMLIAEYFLGIITFIIPFAVYGVIMAEESIFYIMMCAVYLFMPIIPTLIGILLTVLLMSVTNVFRNKDLVQYITVLSAFAIFIVVQLLLTKTSNMTNFTLANKLIEINGLSNSLSNYIIILKQCTMPILKCGMPEAIRNLTYLIGESITAYFLVAFLISRSYIKSATNVVSGKSKKNTKKDKYKVTSVRRAYIIKEFKMLFRTPAFFLNTVLPILIFPILISIPIINACIKVSTEQLDIIREALAGNIQNPMGFAICLCIMLLFYMFNYVSVTAVSRDGENAIFMKCIPIDLHKQCRYKAMPSFILNLYPLILVTVAIKWMLPQLENIFVLEIFIVSFLVNIFISYGAILIDLVKPKLQWATEYSVVKQNLNIFWDIVFVFITGVIIFGICSFFENVHILTFLLCALLILTISFYDNFIKQNSINIFKKIC